MRKQRHKVKGEKETQEPTIFIAFIEMLLKEQNEMDQIKHTSSLLLFISAIVPAYIINGSTLRAR